MFTPVKTPTKRKMDGSSSQESPKKMAGPSRYLRRRQAVVYDKVMESLHLRRPKMFFVEGPAGTGKSFLLKTILEDAANKGYNILAVASTGVSAVQIGGTTAESLFVLPKDELVTDRDSALRDKLRLPNVAPPSEHDVPGDTGSSSVLDPADVGVLAWDDCNMSAADLVMSVDEELRRLTNIDIPFGGRTVVFAGDMRGLLPPPPHKKPCAFFWKNWSLVETYHLNTNMRCLEDPAYAQEILAIGGCGLATPCMDEIAMLDKCMFVHSKEQLIRETFAGCFDGDYPRQDPSRRVILTLKNQESFDFNDEILKALNEKEEVRNLEGETLSQFSSTPRDKQTNDSPHHTLTLKAGLDVILRKTINTEEDVLRMGTVLRIDKITEDFLYCTVRTGPDTDAEVRVPKSTHSYGSFSRTQFPVRLCYARTIYKAQGQSFDRVGLYLDPDVYVHGQLYVALSRVRNKEDVKILSTRIASPRKSYSPGYNNRLPVSPVKSEFGHQKVAIRNVVRKDIFEKVSG